MINNTSLESLKNRRNADGVKRLGAGPCPNRTVFNYDKIDNTLSDKKELPWWSFTRRYDYVPNTILETKDNNVNFRTKAICSNSFCKYAKAIHHSKKLTKRFKEYEEKKEIKIKAISVKCNNRMCEVCGIKIGIKTKKNILKKSNLFNIPKLFTITVNRNNFFSPFDAYKEITENRYIARLFRLMGVKRWIWVLEPQEENGDGWPHWHILIDVSDLPGKWYKNKYIPHFFDLARVHRLIRKWEIGEQCYLTTKKTKTGKKVKITSPEHAINYICKYLTKMPKNGYPEWMLNTPRLRIVGASKQVGCLVAESIKKKHIDKKEKIEEKPRTPARKPIEKLSSCGDEILFHKYDFELDKNVILGICPADLALLSNYEKSVKFKIFNEDKNITYDVNGFICHDDLEVFFKLTSTSKHIEFMQKRKEKRKQEILDRWNFKNEYS